MRTKIWKDALYAGTWVTPKGQVFDCGPDELAYFRDRTKAMLKNGAAIPWCFEHQRDDESTVGLSASDLLARWAKNTGGHIHDVRLAPNGGPLELLLDVDETTPDRDGKTDRQKLESIKFVSPDIRHNWRDRNGPASDDVGPFWPGGSFAHIAITPLPVQYPQRSFDFDKAKSVSLSAAGVDVSLSAAKLLTDDVALGSKDASGHKHDDKGKFSGNVASLKAWNASKSAYEASNSTYDKTDPGSHANAGTKHTAAQEAHTVAAAAHKREGSTEYADLHKAHADLHAQHGERHAEKCGQGKCGTKLSAKDDDMPFPPDDDNLNSPMDDAPPPPPPPTPEGGGMDEDAHRIQTLSEIVKPLGIEVHVTPGMTLADYVDHLHTAFKTHQATKGNDEPDADPAAPAPTPNTGAELAESAPIMMSTATTPATDREMKLARKLVRQSNETLRGRINVLHARGYIDDDIRNELEAEMKTVRLSMADIDDEGEFKPTSVAIRVAAYERVMKTQKPGSFVKGKGPEAKPGIKPNPLKPISTAVALSATEEVIEPEDGDDAAQDRPVNVALVDRLSGGRYSLNLAAQKNGTPQ